MKRFILPLLILALLATSADAGLFSRLRARRAGGCACGVVCPCKAVQAPRYNAWGRIPTDGSKQYQPELGGNGVPVPPKGWECKNGACRRVK
jgi:hypothetical protein